MAVNNSFDQGMFLQKCGSVYQHIFDAYADYRQSVYSEVA